MTKKELLKALEAVPDDAIACFFSGDETLEVANKVDIHDPDKEGYYSPEFGRTWKFRKPRVWFELGRNW